jgi:hypothetical protein
MKTKSENYTFKTRLRILGHKLGMAELYGSKHDLTDMKRAHANMLHRFYRGAK